MALSVAERNRRHYAKNSENRKAYFRTPRGRFSTHKQNARRRGVPFLLTFDEWWAVWEPHWESRGRDAGCVVMSRRGDVGPYAVGNVFIQKMERNISEGQQMKRRKEN